MSPRVILLVALLVAGCNLIAPYKIDIQQGNVITQDMLARVQPGMTRSQVRFALGTPLVVDPFHGDRWDYVYVYMKQGAVMEQRRIVVVFKDDKLAHIEGDAAPAGITAAKTDKPIAEKTDKPAPPAGGTQPEQK
jgi:outer membrane protein assembly factor BamE